MIILFWSLLVIMIIAALLFVVRRPINKTALVIILVLPIAALSLYAKWGDSHQWFEYLMLQKLPKQLGSPNKVIRELQAHLQQNPKSAEGWFLLGRLYASQQQFDHAAQAFANANQLKPKQIKTLLNYAAALSSQQNPTLLPHIKLLLREAIKIDPTNVEAQNLLAVTEYQQGNYKAAIRIWEKLSEQYSPDTPDGKALLKAIALAQSKLKQE